MIPDPNDPGAPGRQPRAEAEPAAESTGPEVEGDTAQTAEAHTVASPSPIPDYALEPAGTPDADEDDTAPTLLLPADTEATVILAPDPPVYLAPEPPPPYLVPEPPPVFPLTASAGAAVPAGATVPATAVAAAYPAASVRPRRRPLLGTIVWGVILLALAGYVLLGVLVPAPADPTLWLLGGVIVIGLLLIVIGLIAALRRAG